MCDFWAWFVKTPGIEILGSALVLALALAIIGSGISWFLGEIIDVFKKGNGD